MSMSKTLKSKIKKTGLVKWQELEWYQPENFKKTSTEKMEKLKLSLLSNGFSSPFYIWEKDGAQFIIDGHHREKALRELQDEGNVIPEELLGIWLEIEDELQAKKMVMTFNSHYADIDKYEMFDFLKDFQLDAIAAEFEPFNSGFTFDIPQPKDNERMINAESIVITHKCPKCDYEW